MIIRVDKAFEKDVKKIKDDKLLKELALCIRELEKAIDIREIKHIRKLQGSKSFYRIKFNDYRIGISIEDGQIDLIRFLNRKDIYKFFP